ncbi:MAG TPA: hypothetical protein VIT83_03445 [Gammaproteobacteria bacterium]
MSGKRGERVEEQEAQARRVLEEQSRRWPKNPNTFYVLLVAALLLILFLAR